MFRDDFPYGQCWLECSAGWGRPIFGRLCQGKARLAPESPVQAAAPGRALEAAVADLPDEEDETPGQRLAQEYRNIYVQVEAALGAQRLSECLAPEQQQHLRSETSILDEGKMSALVHFGRQIDRQFKNELPEAVYTRYLHAEKDKKSVYMKNLEYWTQRYFLDHLQGNSSRISVSFSTKNSGDQLGFQAHIALYESNEFFKYHVKTHSDGYKSQKSSAPHNVNVNELYVYQILDFLEVGCSFHMFGRDQRNLYIATQDAGPDFQVFERATGRRDNMVGYQNLDGAFATDVWGNLFAEIQKYPDCSAIPSDKEKHKAQACEALEGALDEKARRFIDQVVKMDVLSRVLRLSDLINNPDNFGFIAAEGIEKALKIIDFRVFEEERLKFTKDNFGGFLEGNGIYHYHDLHDTLAYVLHHRPVEKRVETAKEVMGGMQNDFATHADQACVSVEERLQDILGEQAAPFIADSQTYRDTAKKNFDALQESLNEWNLEEHQRKRQEREELIQRGRARRAKEKEEERARG